MFINNEEGGCTLNDQVTYSLPFHSLFGGPLGPLFRWKLTRLFKYRHRVTINDLDIQSRYPTTPLKIIVTGATGLVGSALCAFLSTAGHTVLKVSRKRSGSEILWNPESGEIEAEKFIGADCVIHLAGEGIAERRWSTEQKERIRSSRINGTKLIVDTIKKMPAPPKVFIAASAIGYYGDTGSTLVSESAQKGRGFLSDLTQEWENCVNLPNIRTVNARIGVVLSPRGGALKKMLPPFLLGVGGPVGSGKQHLSWICLDDLVYSLYHLIFTESLSGPVNLVAPTPVTNREFSKTLGRVLNRPAVLNTPAKAIELLFGEMGRETVLASVRVSCQKLIDSNFEFKFGGLSDALRHVLGR
jgi:uncharacterized protein (TIGR01777 family)